MILLLLRNNILGFIPVYLTSCLLFSVYIRIKCASPTDHNHLATY